MSVVELILVRHGESEGNVAAGRAADEGAEMIDVPSRDADVRLSDTGTEQARALGAGLGRLPAQRQPDAVWCSTYVRAQQTATIALENAGLDLPMRLDERLRDRELGVLDALTVRGVEARYPDEASRRKWLGKFYHRPAGGESWADLALRIRSLMVDLDRFQGGRRVMLVCHDAVVMTLRYVCEELTEDQVLQAAREDPVRNVSLTRLVREPGAWQWSLDSYNDVSHLEDKDVPVTESQADSRAVPE